jgi:hypothetical protein
MIKKKPFNLQSNFHHKRGHKSECTIVCSYQRFKGDKQFTDRIRKPPSHYIIFPPDLLKGWPRFRKTQQALTLSNSENSKMKKKILQFENKEVFIFGPLLNIFQVKIKFKGY